MVRSGLDSTHSSMQAILSSAARRVQDVLNVTVSSCMLTRGSEALQPMLQTVSIPASMRTVCHCCVCLFVCVCVSVLNPPLLPSTGNGGD